MNNTILILIALLWIILLILFTLQSNQWFKTLRLLTSEQHKQIRAFLEKNEKSQQIEGFKTMLPLRIQASERLVLFLERLQPQQLISRHLAESILAQDLAQQLLRTIREEFDYNLSQQLFVSDMAWQTIRAAKEEMIQLIHLSVGQLQPDAPKADLAAMLYQSEPKLIEQAIGQIRNDLNQLTLQKPSTN